MTNLQTFLDQVEARLEHKITFRDDLPKLLAVCRLQLRTIEHIAKQEYAGIAHADAKVADCREALAASDKLIGGE